MSTQAIPLKEIEEFITVVRRLRKECPWDREQTHESIRDMLIEEAYEVIETIDKADPAGLRNELGDILLHVAMHSVIAEEQGTFDLKDVIRAITAKLIHRHPHVFGVREVRGAADVRSNWEMLKLDEGRQSVLEGVPPHLPALQQAARLQEKASRVGFDWKNPEDVWEKVREELDECRRALENGPKEKREEEFGDLLFSLVNYSRFLRINAEGALRVAIKKFVSRFTIVEEEIRKAGKDIRNATPEELDQLWNRSKARLAENPDNQRAP
ncbi:MAG: nucleoside triphosphate pyrophosphohydrolase [Ignavibacteria bacterium]|nr:nucleoside triphosphate pyrophosphohydrolase [Ignavibacteria bacterium]